MRRLIASAAVAAAVLPAAIAVEPAAHAAPTGCTAGARSLESPGSVLYPETGNGGYTSVHTLVRLVYDADSNRFLPGNHVELTQRATQCLSSFSLDFERRSVDPVHGPDMDVTAVTIDGHPAAFRFAVPTYPGNPNGPDDPDPRAHQASQTNPVGGPNHNPLPPACTPQIRSGPVNARNGTACPATKLVIEPAAPIPAGTNYTVSVAFTGRPGVHTTPDGGMEGWFREPNGGYVNTEPAGTEDWMPLNNHPSAKPTYDFLDTVTAGRTVIANGILTGVRQDAPSNNFPHGSTTFHWQSSAPIASYLVENSVGRYRLTKRVVDGRPFYQAQAVAIGAGQQQHNTAIMSQQPQITNLESQFTGPYPFTSNGVMVGTPNVHDQMEMQTMIVFDNGYVDQDTLWHENMHLWWGDNVGESSYHLTFFKEGMATVAEFLRSAYQNAAAAGGLNTARGRAVFEATLVRRFNSIYAHRDRFWTGTPSNPAPYALFSDSTTYLRPGAAYLALRAILGPDNFTRALTGIQHDYAGGTITEAQLEAGFASRLPHPNPTCRARLHEFFTQWFDTAYPPGGGPNRPTLTGPGLDGGGFTC